MYNKNSYKTDSKEYGEGQQTFRVYKKKMTRKLCNNNDNTK